MDHAKIAPSHQTGIDAIDEQHEHILKVLAELQRASQLNDAIKVERGVNEIFSLIIDHFGLEETLMEQVGYPYLKAHKRLHDYLIQRLAGYTQRLDAGEQIAEEMGQFLQTWLYSHFTHEDRDYAPHILEEEKQAQASDQPTTARDSWISRAIGLVH